MIISSSPLRVSLFGGGTDLPSFYEKNRCHILGFASDYRCYVNLNPMTVHTRESKYRLVYSKVEETDNIDKVQHPLIRAYLSKYQIHETELHFTSDLPAVSGLGSSSAFACALGAVCRTFSGKEINPHQLSNEAINIERNRLSEAGGVQDQIISAYGGICEINASAAGVIVEPVVVDDLYRNEFSSHLVLVKVGWDSNVNRFSHDIELKKTSNDENINILSQILELSDLGIQQFKKQNIEKVGELVQNIWDLKKRHSGVTNNTIDDCADYLKSKGAVGWRLLGAGGRGFMLGIGSPDFVTDVIGELGSKKALPIKISLGGTQILE